MATTAPQLDPAQAKLVLAEYLRRKPQKIRKAATPRSIAFAKQRALVASTSRRDVAILPRQAGKTTAAVLRALDVASRTDARLVTYITRTRKNAERLFWRPLLEWAERLGFDVGPGAVNLAKLQLRIRHEDGSYCIIELLGAHDLDQIGDLRGTQYDLVIVDEAQLIRPMILDEFLGAVIIPGLRARQGALLLIGTPGPVRFGPFWNAWNNAEYGKFHWTAYDNPATPPGSIEAEAAELGLKLGDARYVREYLGQWFDGHDESRVWDYDPVRNAPDVELPTKWIDGWQFSWGIDLASSTDNDALVVLGWKPTDGERRVYEVDNWQAPGTEDYEDLAAVLRSKLEQWKPSCAVGDHGGHGATKLINTFRSRLGVPITAKKSNDVEATIRLMNNDLRTGRLRVRAGALAQDMQMEVWEVKPTGKRVISGDYHSDLTAAARYAWTAQHAFRAEAKPEPKNEIQARDWAIRDYLQQQADRRKRSRWA